MIIGLSTTLSVTLTHGLIVHGVPAAVATKIGGLPPVSILFAAFLGYNPIRSLVGARVLAHLSAANRTDLIGHSYFPNLISAPFHSGLKSAFIFGVAVLLIAAAASWSRGSKYIHSESEVRFGEQPKTLTSQEEPGDGHRP
jgi:hypothetical protein